MTRVRAQGNTKKPTLAYSVDEHFIKEERRKLPRLVFGLGLLSQVGLWICCLSGALKAPMPWWSVVLINISVLLVACPLISLFALVCMERFAVFLSESEMFVYLVATSKKIAFSTEAPLVVKKSASGKYWEISSAASGAKCVKLRCRVFPRLDRFVVDAKEYWSREQSPQTSLGEKRGDTPVVGGE